MSASFFFYDLETSGINPREARIMQFAGQRTDMNLKPIGEPHNILIKLTDDVLPEPDAVLITGITPQKTIAEGITEVEFLQLFHKEIATEGTIFVGFNTVRFDDEFMRYLHYRNFYDPYEWQWKDDRSRWDLLDMVRMTRALRPEGINWPYASDGKPSNRLELLTSVNNLAHSNAHDALSDVHATIAVAQLIKDKQPKLFSFLLSLRSKQAAKQLTDDEQMFVYSSGKYSNEQEKTTIATKIADTPEGAALVYDLSVDPTPYLELSEVEIATAWQRRFDDPEPKLPVKTLKYNRCPAIAPLGVLDTSSQKRLGLDPKKAKTYMAKIKKSDFAKRCIKALEIMNKARAAKQESLLFNELNVDVQLYDDFLPSSDKSVMQEIYQIEPEALDELMVKKLHDDRLKALLPLYKARNFPGNLSSSEREAWEAFRAKKLLLGGMESQAAKYMKRLAELDAITSDPEKRYLLEELQLYAESILPDPS